MTRSIKPLLQAAILAIMLSAVLISAVAPSPSLAGEPRPIFYNVTTDDTWTAGMALSQANVAASRGHPVTVFLNVRAVHLADREAVLGTFGPSGKTPAELIAALVAKEQTVLVCGTCMKVGGMVQDDLLEGVVMASPNLTFGALNRAGTIALSY
jgi:predicted peroxiredoxin